MKQKYIFLVVRSIYFITRFDERSEASRLQLVWRYGSWAGNRISIKIASGFLFTPMVEKLHLDEGRSTPTPPVVIPDIGIFLPRADYAKKETLVGKPLFYAFDLSRKIDYQSHLMGKLISSDLGYGIEENPSAAAIEARSGILLGEKLPRIDLRYLLENFDRLKRERLREHGEVMCAILQPGLTGVDVFSQPIPPLPKEAVATLKQSYADSRQQLHPDTQTAIKDDETEFDRSLLHLEVMAKRSHIDVREHTEFYAEVERLYANRLDALNEGFVTLGNEKKFSLIEHKRPEDDPNAIQIGSKRFLPDLPSLSFVFQLQQAGFEVRLAERSNSLAYPLAPTRNSFAIMIRPQLDLLGKQDAS